MGMFLTKDILQNGSVFRPSTHTSGHFILESPPPPSQPGLVYTSPPDNLIGQWTALFTVDPRNFTHFLSDLWTLRTAVIWWAFFVVRFCRMYLIFILHFLYYTALHNADFPSNVFSLRCLYARVSFFSSQYLSVLCRRDYRCSAPWFHYILSGCPITLSAACFPILTFTSVKQVRTSCH